MTAGLVDQDGELHLHLHRALSQLHLSTAPNNTDNPLPDICPVCKSSRYLNKSMRFLVNPECYHKMCESCVDRIFSHGPNKCPIAGCKRTLRKHRFREQTFEDIRVEREVDIRKRVAAIFNRREDEFESERDYNDYLNEVEDVTFNLINGVDVEASEKKLHAYAAANARAISDNAALASRETNDYAALQAAEREQARLRRLAARREEEEERRERVEGRQNIINRLAAGDAGDAAHIADESQRVTLKKRLDRQAQAERQRQLNADDSKGSNAVVSENGDNSNGGFVIKGLKTRKATTNDTAEPPFDAFGALALGQEYYTLQDDYAWSWLNDARQDLAIAAGGYNIHEFYARAMCEAFSGLGVFVADEKVPDADGVAGKGARAAMGTVAAAAVAASGPGSRSKEVKMEDPF